MLDEPTNHLDMHSVDLLIEALNKYEGSLIIVSHDRHFISRTANVFWEIIDGKIRDFRGTYEEYVRWKEKLVAEEAEKVAVKKETGKPVADTSKPKVAPSNHNLLKNDLVKQQKLFEKLEKELDEIRTRHTAAEQKLADPAIYSDHQKFKEAENQLKQLQQQLNIVQGRYEAAFEKLVEMEEAMNG
jgi:ATP-binding cassette subfamily F protein 3